MAALATLEVRALLAGGDALPLLGAGFEAEGRLLRRNVAALERGPDPPEDLLLAQDAAVQAWRGRVGRARASYEPVARP